MFIFYSAELWEEISRQKNPPPKKTDSAISIQFIYHLYETCVKTGVNVAIPFHEAADTEYFGIRKAAAWSIPYFYPPKTGVSTDLEVGVQPRRRT